MLLKVKCPYCSGEHILKLTADETAPKRPFVKVKCVYCASRFGIDFGIRRLGASLKVKQMKAESDRVKAVVHWPSGERQGKYTTRGAGQQAICGGEAYTVSTVETLTCGKCLQLREGK